MSSATDALLKAAKAVLDDREMRRAAWDFHLDAQAKLSALFKAVREVEDENRKKGPP